MDLFSFLLGKKMGGGSPSPTTNKFTPTRLSFVSTDWSTVESFDFAEGLDVRNLTDVSQLFYGNRNFKNSVVDLGFLEGAKPKNWKNAFTNINVNEIKNLDKLNFSLATDLSYLFSGATLPKNISFWKDTLVLNAPNGLDFSNAFNMSNNEIYPAKSITIKADYPTKFDNTFRSPKYEEIVIETKSTKVLSSMSFIASYTATASRCLKKFSITSKEDNTSSVKVDLSNAFSSTTNWSESFTECDLSGLWGKQTGNINNMFTFCKHLTEIDMRGIIFIPQSHTYCTKAFCECQSLQKLNICNFVLKGLTTAPSEFVKNVPTDCTIIVKDENEVAWWGSKFPTYSNVRVATDEERFSV